MSHEKELEFVRAKVEFVEMEFREVVFGAWSPELWTMSSLLDEAPDEPQIVNGREEEKEGGKE